MFNFFYVEQVLLLFLSRLCTGWGTQCETWTHNPEIKTWAEIKSWTLNWLSHPGPPTCIIFKGRKTGTEKIKYPYEYFPSPTELKPALLGLTFFFFGRGVVLAFKALWDQASAPLDSLSSHCSHKFYLPVALSHFLFPENTSSYFWALCMLFRLTRIADPCFAHLKQHSHFMCCSGILSCETTPDPLPHLPCQIVPLLSPLFVY